MYILSTIGLYYEWMDVGLTFITVGESFWTAFNFIPSTSMLLTVGIGAILSTALADATLAWDLIFVFV